jgi:hypothetical protein
MFDPGVMAAALAACAISALVFVLVYPYFAADRKAELRLRGLADGPGGGATQSAREAAASRRKAVTETL